MRILFCTFLLPFLLLSASDLNRDAKDFYPSQGTGSSLFDFCLNSESLSDIEALRIRRSSDSPESVFALLREGQSLLSPQTVARESPEPQAKPSSAPAPRLIPIQHPQYIFPQHAYMYHPHQQHQLRQQHQEQQQRMMQYQPVMIQTPIIPLIRFSNVHPVPLRSPPFPNFIVTSSPQPIHQQPLYNPSIFNIYRLDKNSMPCEFLTQISNLFYLAQAIEFRDLFNCNGRYYLVSASFSSRPYVIENISNTVFFSIRLNPIILKTVIPKIQRLLWSFEAFLKGLLTIVLDFKISREGSAIYFIFQQKNAQLASEMRESLLTFCDPSFLGTWIGAN